jgi:hypothetical protein
MDDHRRKDRQRTGAVRSGARNCLSFTLGKYWTEIGQHHAGADNTWRDISRLVDYFGAAKLLTEVTDNDVARLVAWRRGHRVIRGQQAQGRGVSADL